MIPTMQAIGTEATTRSASHAAALRLRGYQAKPSLLRGLELDWRTAGP